MAVTIQNNVISEYRICQVTKEEFNRFIKKYRLVGGENYMSTPPLLLYHHKRLPAFVIVARTRAYSDDPNDDWYCSEEEREYFIISNIKDLLKRYKNYKKGKW